MLALRSVTSQEDGSGFKSPRGKGLYFNHFILQMCFPARRAMWKSDPFQYSQDTKARTTFWKMVWSIHARLSPAEVFLVFVLHFIF